MADLPLYGPLHDGLKSLLASSKYSDLTIFCNGREFKVHKAVLCSQSGYFTKMLDGDWKEAKEGVVNVDEDLQVFEAMLHFLYNFEYNYAGDDDKLFLDADIYSIADKYDIQHLKRYAREEFTKTLEVSWNPVHFIPAIAQVYSTTPSTDRGLRDIVVAAAIENDDVLMNDEAFAAILEETAPFSADMTKALLKERDPRTTKSKNGKKEKVYSYRCPCCEYRWYSVCILSGSELLPCDDCGFECTATRWKEHMVAAVDL